MFNNFCFLSDKWYIGPCFMPCCMLYWCETHSHMLVHWTLHIHEVRVVYVQHLPVNIRSPLEEICLWQFSSMKFWNQLKSCISYGDHIIRELIFSHFSVLEIVLKLMKGLQGKCVSLRHYVHMFLFYTILNSHMQAMH